VNLLFKPIPNPVAGTIGFASKPLIWPALSIMLALSFVPVGLRPTQSVLLLFSFALLLLGLPQLSWRTGLLLLLIAGIAAAQAIGVAHSTVEEKNFIRPAAFPFFLLVGVLAHMFARCIRIEQQGKYMAKVATWLLGFFSIECLTRFVLSPYLWARHVENEFAGMPLEVDRAFYHYKFSIFYVDSNNVGLALLCLLALMLAFRRHLSGRQVALGYLLLLLTFSRASIIAGLCQYLIYKFWHARRWILLLIIAAAPIVVYGLLASYISAGSEQLRQFDGSLASKFLILQKMGEVYAGGDLRLWLFGIGAGNTEQLITIAAHSIIVTYALEFGIVGSILVTCYVWVLSRKSQSAKYLLVLPMVVNGFALILASMPYFFVTLGVLSALTTPAAPSAEQLEMRK